MSINIKRVAVIGSGVMGSGISALLAGTGIEVLLYDIVPNELTDKEKKEGLLLEDKKVKNRISQANKEFAFTSKNRISYSKKDADLVTACNLEDDLEKLSTCDWIIEVIVEKLEMKKDLMKKIYKYWNKKAIVSTNTSGVEVSKIVEDMPEDFKKNFLGTHFFNPVRYMKLMEIIPTQSTDEGIVDFMIDFGENTLGKGVVTAKDTPCFIANRIGAYSYAIVFDVMKKYDFTISEIDIITGKVMARPKSAIFRTLDMVGIDTMVNVFKNLQQQLNEKSENDIFAVPEYTQYLLENKYLGDKSGQGFYLKQKKNGKKEILEFNLKTNTYEKIVTKELHGVEEATKHKDVKHKLSTLVYGEHEDNKFAWEIIKNILIYSANRVPEIADDYKMIDKAMKWGYNWTIGPFEIWDSIDFKKSVNKMLNEGEILPDWVMRRIENGEMYFYENIKIDVVKAEKNIILQNEFAKLEDVGDNVACLTFLTKNNLFDDGLIEFINNAIDIVEENEYIGIITVNNGKNFSTGLDLASINTLIENGKYEELEILAKKINLVFNKMKHSKKYMVSAPFNMTLDEGMEYVMHSHGVVAHAETYMGLVKVGVGLIPFAGGLKEILFNTKSDTDKFVYEKEYGKIRNMWNFVANGKVTKSAHEAFDLGLLNKKRKIIMNKDNLVHEAKKMVIEMNNNKEKTININKIPVVGNKGEAALSYEINMMGDGNFISGFEVLLAKKISNILCAGDITPGIVVDEKYLVESSIKSMLELSKEEKAKERIREMLLTGKVVRN